MLHTACCLLASAVSPQAGREKHIQWEKETQVQARCRTPLLWITKHCCGGHSRALRQQLFLYSNASVICHVVMQCLCKYIDRFLLVSSNWHYQGIFSNFSPLPPMYSSTVFIKSHQFCYLRKLFLRSNLRDCFSPPKLIISCSLLTSGKWTRVRQPCRTGCKAIAPTAD